MVAITPAVATVDVPAAAGTSVQYLDVPGGRLYWSSARQGTGPAQLSAPAFVPSGGTVNMALTNAKTVLGIPLGVAAGTPAGAVGVVRVAGTSLTLDGEATSASTKTNACFFEANLPTGYIAGNNVTLDVNANITGSGTLTAASCIMTPTVFTEINGVEAALTVSAAQQIVAAGSTLSFVITGTSIAAGSKLGIGLSMAVVSSSGANTGHINAVALRS